MTPPKIVPCELVSHGSIAMRIAGSEFMKRIVNGKRQMVNARGTKLSVRCLNRAVTNFPHERGFHYVYALRFDSGFSDRRVYLLPFPGRALRCDCGFRLRRVRVQRSGKAAFRRSAGGDSCWHWSFDSTSMAQR